YDHFTSTKAFIQCREDDEFHFGFPYGGDPKLFVRAVLASAQSASDVSLDISDLVNGGYVDQDENLVADAVEQISEDYVVGAKVIVLTEGSSDSRILSRTLKLLYPHLSEYYSFLNFETASVKGGAPSLVEIIKSFIGSGIVNRTIALFDNDAAALSHMKQLEKIRKEDIPTNIRITRLPDIEIAEQYPTFGPQGRRVQNVNGLAAGIELYFGRDLLTQTDGDLIPVQWINFEAGINKYHGVVREKQTLHERYEQKLRKCELNRALIERHDFTGMRAICDHLFSAFSKS
ncbi:MAG: HEPN/Toprim-associated domain-containing protein, partial [Acidobacteriota bacterium]